MADFIVLKRPGPPSREVLVNLDEILMVLPGQSSGSAVLFGKDHLVNFEVDFATVIRRIQNRSLRATRSRQSLRFIAPLATKSTADRSLKSLRA